MATPRVSIHGISRITVQRRLYDGFDCTEVIAYDANGASVQIDAFSMQQIAFEFLADEVTENKRDADDRTAMALYAPEVSEGA